MIGWAVLAALLAVGVILTIQSPSAPPTPAAPEVDSPYRIVSLAPNVTEILFSLELGDRVVGVTRFCNQPEAVGALPKVGGYIDPNVEAILALKPTHVIAVEEAKNETVLRQLESLGVRVEILDTRTLAGLKAGISQLAGTFGVIEHGKSLHASLETTMNEVDRRTSSQPHPKVLVVLGHQPLVVAGKGIFVDELITAAGGRNVAAVSEQEYPVWSIEHVIEAAPDVIVEVTMGGEASLSWKDWQGIPAVRHGRVVSAMDPDLILRSGPRITQGLNWLAGVIHPALFSGEKK